MIRSAHSMQNKEKKVKDQKPAKAGFLIIKGSGREDRYEESKTTKI